MKLLIVFFLSLWVLAAAEAPAKKTPRPAAAAPAAPARAAAAPKEIPAGAFRSDDGSYHYTDPRGKKWLYRKTPFGIARLEDKPVDLEQQAADSRRRFADVTVVEDGDTIRFERPGPFGIYKWQRKKSQLNEMEQTVWDRERARAAVRQD